MSTMHLSPETALDLLEGRMDSVQDTLWREHLDVCRDCTQSVDQWKQFQIALTRPHLKSAPAHDLESAFRIFPARPDEGVSKLRRVLAVLIFDSFFEPAPAGARGVSAAARQLVLHADEFDIHVQLWGERDHMQMLGQILPRNGEGFASTARFHLLRNGERLETTDVDDLGEFQFDDVPDANLSLQIDLPNLTVIAALNIKEPQ
jgi:hypothetical protein